VFVLGALDADRLCPIFAYPLAGGAPRRLMRIHGPGGEVPMGLPFALRLDRDSVYFLQSGASNAVFNTTPTLYRIGKSALDGDPSAVFSASSLGPPRFDASSIYVSYERGGLTAPIEGVIARLPK
ncbi:MAG: hypothetical protein ACHREM_10030, partial [Polyangiales bacterium]